MLKDRRSTIFAAFGLFFLTVGLILGVVAFEANEDRWHQGPTVVVLSPEHGLHEMDVLLLGGALASALMGAIAIVIAKR